MAQVGTTPPATVRLLCDYAEPRLSDLNARFFEPGCGDGNFLVEVLSRRLHKIPRDQSPANFQNAVLLTVANLYGVDISALAISETRRRLQSLVLKFVEQHSQPDYRFNPILEQILEQNFFVATLPQDCPKITFPIWRRKCDFEFIATPTLWPKELAS